MKKKNYVMHTCIALDKKVIRKEKHPEKKRHTERRNLSIHSDLSHSLIPRTQSEIKVVNPQTQEEVFMGKICIPQTNISGS